MFPFTFLSLFSFCCSEHTNSFDNVILEDPVYETAYTWALESQDPDELLSYSYTDPVGGIEDFYALRWTESGVEISVEVDGNWTYGDADWQLADPPL